MDNRYVGLDAHRRPQKAPVGSVTIEHVASRIDLRDRRADHPRRMSASSERGTLILERAG